MQSGSRRRDFPAARCSVETAVVTVGQVTEVDKDSFWPIVKATGEKIVVLDMYTQWYALRNSCICSGFLQAYT